jgi:hypothetical protein
VTAMAKMTLERAERILGKTRNWYSQDMTDLQRVKKLESAKRDGGFGMLIFSLTFLRFSNYKDWDTMVTWALLLGFMGFAIFLIIQSSRYSKIRELFEEAGPQNLADLKFPSLDKP